ncbi:MAG: NAD-dependent epimerase/dehydratase family protein [Methanolinea sp.]|jgi:nucleoside-diphosphate-sugar epimerase|nr:NAD-dependent epimerase/dehydratase family protein [Methanolinea sp.]
MKLPGTAGIFRRVAIPSVPRSIKDPVATNMVNVNGTIAVLVAAKECGVRKVVYASSSFGVWGHADPAGRWRESLNVRTVSSERETEAFVREGLYHYCSITKTYV